MMMERLRWLVAVLVAFVAGWVGHAVYGERPEPSPPSVSATLAESAPGAPAAPSSGQEAEATVDPSTPASGESGKQALVEPPKRFDNPFSSPGAVDALMQAVEASNRKWMAEFEAEGVDPAWSAQAEDELRRGFASEQLFGQARIESILCKSTKCRLVVLNERQDATPETTPETTPDPMSTWRAWPTLRAGGTSYERLPDGQPGFRATVFVEKRAAPLAPPP